MTLSLSRLRHELRHYLVEKCVRKKCLAEKCEKVWVDGGHFLNTNKSALSVVFLANTSNSWIIHFHVTYFVSHMSWDILIDCVCVYFFFFIIIIILCKWFNFDKQRTKYVWIIQYIKNKIKKAMVCIYVFDWAYSLS